MKNLKVKSILFSLLAMMAVAVFLTSCEQIELTSTVLEEEVNTQELYSTEMPEGMTLEDAQNEISKIVAELKKDPEIVREAEELLQNIGNTSSFGRSAPTAAQCARAQLCKVTAHPGNVFNWDDVVSSIYMRVAYDKNPKNSRLSAQEIIQFMPSNVRWIGFRWVNIEAVDYIEYNFNDFSIANDCI